MKKKLITVSLAVALLTTVVGEEVQAHSNGWTQNEFGYTYVKDGSIVKNTWELVGNDWYHFDNQGHMQIGWQYISENWYNFDQYGHMQTDWQYINGYWYHFDQYGHMQTSWQYINGYWYHFDQYGHMQTGWQYLSGSWYNFDQYGHMQTGWQYLDGSWYYFYSGGSCAVNCWQDGTYLGSSGRAEQTGWVKRQQYWYYLINGEYAKNKWVGEYYFRSDGRMARNSWIDNYFVGATGACVYNSFVGDWYVGANGKAVFGQWISHEGDWYYIDHNGHYLRNDTYVEGKTEYSFGSNGKITQTKQVGRTSIIGGLSSPIVASDRVTYPNDNILWEYTPIPNYYAAERKSPVGKKVHKLRVGDTITIDGKHYRVRERKTGLTYNDVNRFVTYLNSSHYDAALQTCDDAATYIVILKLTLIK